MIRQAIATTTLAALGAVGFATPSAAAPAERHCVTNGTSLSCYADFRGAIAAATAGRVTDAPRSARAAATSPRFAQALAAAADAPAAPARRASTVIGISYAGFGYTGSSLIHLAAASCDDTLSNLDAWNYVMAAGWDDRVRSFRTYANCWAKYYYNSYLTGSSYGYATTNNLPDWLAGRASSIAWS